MIVKLHEVRKDRPYPIYVNLDAIQYFAKSINGDDTRIKFAGDNIYLFVKESIEEIAEMMKPKSLKNKTVELQTYLDSMGAAE